MGALVQHRVRDVARRTAARVLCAAPLVFSLGLFRATETWAQAPSGPPAAPEPAPAGAAPVAADDAHGEPHISFKPGRGAVITSADGNYEFGAHVRLQFLSIVEHSSSTDTVGTFQLRRARFGSTGHIGRPELKYRLELAFGPREVNTLGGVPQTSPLLDANFDWQRYRDVNVRAGQYKVPLDRQRIIPFFRLQFIDRAITDTEFTFDRDMGFDLHSEDLFGLGLLRYSAGIFTGDGRNSFLLNDSGLTYVARISLFPFGLFDDYSEGDFDHGGLRVSLAGGYLFIQDAPRDRGILGAAPADGGTSDLQVGTADALIQFKGLSLMSAFFYRKGERNPGSLSDEDGVRIPTAPSRDGVGFLAQGGYLLPWLPLELAARYAVLDGTDAEGRDGLPRSEEFAGALNYYVSRHQFKLQANYARIAQNGDYAGSLGRLLLQVQAAF
jgi:phosphate-selective porin OprO/OprP